MASMRVNEWDKARNCEGFIAIWDDDPNRFPPQICEIVQEIRQSGFAVRGDSIYSDYDEEDGE